MRHRLEYELYFVRALTDGSIVVWLCRMMHDMKDELNNTASLPRKGMEVLCKIFIFLQLAQKQMLDLVFRCWVWIVGMLHQHGCFTLWNLDYEGSFFDSVVSGIVCTLARFGRHVCSLIRFTNCRIIEKIGDVFLFLTFDCFQDVLHMSFIQKIVEDLIDFLLTTRSYLK